MMATERDRWQSGERALERLLAHLPGDLEAARRLVAEPRARAAIEAGARSVGFLPLLQRHLPEVFSAPAKDLLAARFQAARLARATAELCHLLEASGVPVIALKGAVLAQRLYPEPWLRPSTDIDLLVQPVHLDAASRAMEARGWRPVMTRPESALELSHHVTFAGPGRLYLELHFSPACGFQSEFDVSRLFTRTRPIAIGGQQVRALGAVDELIHQCVHAAHHGFQGAKWLYDLKLTLGEGPLDWGQLVEEARRARVASATGMALREAVRRLGAPAPPVLEALGPGRARLALVRAVERAPREWFGVYLLSLALTDRLSWRWAKELAARPVERVARAAGVDRQLKALVRRVW
jgi:hypothetical protein